MTVIGWVVGGFALAFGVWMFVAFLDWLGDLGSGFTEEQARRQIRRSLERKQQSESTAAKR